MNYRSKILNRLQIELKKDDRKPVIYSSLILVFLFILVLLFLIPSLDIITQLKSRNTELQAKEQELTSIYNTYKTASEHYNVIRDKVSIFELNIPEDSDPYYFVKQVNNFGIKNSVSLKSLRLISKQEGVEGYDVSLSGTYPNIKNFFNDLKKDTRYFSTEFMLLKPGSERAETSKLSLNAKIYIFYKL